MNYDPNGSNLLDLINFAKDKDITKEEALTHFNIPRDNFEDWYKSVLPKNEEYFEFQNIDYDYMTKFDKEIEECV